MKDLLRFACFQLLIGFFLYPNAISGQLPANPQVDSIFRHMNTTATPGCALSVMEEGNIIYEKGYGMANLEYGITISPQSVFHVASVSKHFTAMAIELLVNEGKVSWDDDIRKYAPEVPDFGKTITLRHLVHHTSGLRDQWSLLGMSGWRWEADRVTQKDVLDITSRQTALNFEPGSRYLYCNTGFTLLAVVVERISGKSLREFCEEHMFKPLGMMQTHFHDDYHRIVPDRAYAYSPDVRAASGWRNSIPDFDVVGATSLFTTVHDLAAWDRNFYSGQVGGEKALDRLFDPFVLNSGDTISYRHGLVENNYKGLRTQSHGGADAGYRSHFLRFPDQQLTVSVLCNYPSANPGGLAYRVADVYLKDELTDREVILDKESPAVKMDAKDLEVLAGMYHATPGSTVYRIRWWDGQLRFRSQPLTPLGDHRFKLGESTTTIILKPATKKEQGTFQWASGSSDIYQRYEPWKPTEKELEAFVGTYHSEELDTEYEFTLEEAKLMFNHRKMESGSPFPLFKDAFNWRGLIRFTRDKNDQVDGFYISTGRVWQVRFERLED